MLGSVPCGCEASQLRVGLTLRAGSGIVDCRFDPCSRVRLEPLAPEREVVIGGALVDRLRGNPDLVTCLFADEWKED